MSEIDRVRTPLSELEVGRALRDGYVALFGRDPSFNVLGVGWAQIALENAHGNAIYDFNFGNITGTGEGGDYYTLATDEQVKPGVWKNMTMKYAAHPDAVSGARAYWRLITNSRYAPAFPYFVAGDAVNAAIKLHSLGYFTANPGDANSGIAHSFGALFKHFEDVVAPGLGGLVREVPKAGDEPC